MPQDPSDDIPAGMFFFVDHPERTMDVSHYFRQIAISQRRQVPWINRSWARNRAFVLHPPPPWKS
jgi:hypothetical protein